MAITVPVITTFNNKGLNDATDAFGRFGRKVGDIGKKAAAGLAAIGVAAVAGAGKAINLASDFAESQAKIGEIFGANAVAIEAFAATAATSLGQSKQEVLDAAGTFGIFGDAAGLGGQDLVNFSNDFTTLASDLASFNNTSPQEAIEAIGSALRGESEPLRKYGVMLDDAALKAEALAQGIYNGKGPLTQQQKILASTAVIFKKTTKAQGDFARTSDGLANRTRVMKAQLSNAAVTIGTALLPLALKMADFFATRVIPVVEKLSNVFSKDGLSGILDLIKGQLPKLSEAFSALFDWIKTTGIPKFLEFMGKMGNALVDWIGQRIKPALEKLGEFVVAVAEWLIETGLPALGEKLLEWGNAFVDWIKPLIKPALAAFGTFITKIASWLLETGLPKLLEITLKLADALIGWIIDIAPDAIKGLVNFIAKIAKWIVTDGVPGMVKLGVQLGAGLIDALIKALKGIASIGLDIGKAFANGIIGFINDNVIDSINDLLEFKIAGFTVNPPDLAHIPKLADGGIVNSPTIAMIGEKGPEAVIPLSGRNAGNMGGNTITINTSADPQAVVLALQMYNRMSGPIPINTRGN